MPDTKTCTHCKGEGFIEVIESEHDDTKSTIKCPKCNGKGVIHWMTKKEEWDYHMDYW